MSELPCSCPHFLNKDTSFVSISSLSGLSIKFRTDPPVCLNIRYSCCLDVSCLLGNIKRVYSLGNIIRKSK